MPVYNLSRLWAPQEVSTGAAQLTFAPVQALNLGSVPKNYNYIISELRVSNITSSPVTLSVWLCPNGTTPVAGNNIILSINVPPSTQTFPAFDVLPLWGEVLLPGDSVYMQAGTGSALVAYGSGIVAVP